MGNIVANQALGRAVELYNRVDVGDPSTARLVVVLLASTGLEADSVLKDADTFAVLVSGTTNEATNTGVSRKVLTSAMILAFTVDDVNDRIDLDIDDQTWATVANDGTGGIGALVVCYDPTSAGVTDTAMIPISKHDFVVVPDGSNITAQVSASGFLRAS